MVNQLLETSHPASSSALRLRASARASSPIFRTLFQVPYRVTPLLATLTKTPGVWGYSSRFGTSSLATRHSLQAWHTLKYCSNTNGPNLVSLDSTMHRRLIRIALILLLFPPLLAAVGGWFLAPAFLHPIRRQLTPDLIREADASLAVTGSTREDFEVTAPDGAPLRGWKVRPKNPNGSWVLLFHGVADNRIGVVSQSEFLLRAGYSVVLMDFRAHGASGGPIATYGWLERNDTRAIIDALLYSENHKYIIRQMSIHPDLPSLPRPAMHIFALGESMGAGIALQSAAVDPRIEAVVAEASFANMREASYDYAGLRKYPWLGKTLFVPFSWTLLYRGEKLAALPIADVSPVKAVAARAFPVLLICDEKDVALPCRHSEMIYAAARGPKQLWVVPGAYHTAAYGFAPEEFRRRVLSFFAAAAANPAANPASSQNKIPRVDFLLALAACSAVNTHILPRNDFSTPGGCK
jgi:alpha-beta hydrolase superfamily lysophospholipase